MEIKFTLIGSQTFKKGSVELGGRMVPRPYYQRLRYKAEIDEYAEECYLTVTEPVPSVSTDQLMTSVKLQCSPAFVKKALNV